MGKSKQPENAAMSATARVVAEKAAGLPPTKKYELLKALNEGNMGKVNQIIGPK